MNVERDTLKAKWQQEKELVEKIQDAKANIENLSSRPKERNAMEIMEKWQKSDMEKSRKKEKMIEALTRQLNEVAPEKRLLKEEVDAEDIAEAVAKATGIPVSKMLQS